MTKGLSFILLIIVSSMFSLSLSLIILILTALSWPYTARLIRGQVLALRPREFVEAARKMGASGRWILTRHMVPNTLGISVVTATFSIADSIYALSALSFLGIGPPPFTDWGTMLSDGGQQPVQWLLVAGVLAVDRAGSGRGGVQAGR